MCCTQTRTPKRKGQCGKTEENILIVETIFWIAMTFLNMTFKEETGRK